MDNKPIYLLFPVAEIVLLHSSWRNSIQQKFIDVPSTCQAVCKELGRKREVSPSPCSQRVHSIF